MKIEQLFRLVEQAENRLKNNDAVFAAEKLYKAAEESIKILAIRNTLTKSGKSRWTTNELNDCAKQLALTYGDNLKKNWDIAFKTLHRDGFHENNLKPEDILDYISNVMEIIEIVKSNKKHSS